MLVPAIRSRLTLFGARKSIAPVSVFQLPAVVVVRQRGIESIGKAEIGVAMVTAVVPLLV